MQEEIPNWRKSKRRYFSNFATCDVDEIAWCYEGKGGCRKRGKDACLSLSVCLSVCLSVQLFLLVPVPSVTWHIVSCYAICSMTCAEFCVPKKKIRKDNGRKQGGKTGRNTLLLFLAEIHKLNCSNLKWTQPSSAHFKNCSLHRKVKQNSRNLKILVNER